MADIFISYKREDRASAERLAHALELLGFSVWYDFDLLSGDRYRSVIRQIIDQCKVAVVLWSRLSVESDFVVDEATHAKTQGKLCPVRLDDVSPPFGFGSIHVDELGGWDGEMSHRGFLGLVQAIEQRVGRKAKLGSGTRGASEQAATAELDAFKTAQLAGTATALALYAKEYPRGMFASFVRNQLAQMESPQLPRQPVHEQAGSTPHSSSPQHETHARAERRRMILGFSAGSIVLAGLAGFASRWWDSDAAAPAVAAPADPVAGQRSWIGATLMSVNARLAQIAGLAEARGAFISRLVPTGPAERAGLLLGDIVLSLNQSAITGVSDLMERIANTPALTQTSFNILRAGNYQTLTFAVEARPPEDVVDAMNPALPTTVQPATTRIPPEKLDIGRWTPLGFYPGAQLWELSQYGSDAMQVYLLGPSGAPLALDGTSTNIHQYNTYNTLLLDQNARALQYLNFFCACVWGAEGAFYVVEHDTQLPAADRAQFGQYVKPAVVERVGDTFEIAATIVYDGFIFDAKFRLQLNGNVEMLEDQPKAQEPMTVTLLHENGQRRPATLDGLAVANWPLSPVVAGSWKNATTEEFALMRQMIMMASAR